MKTKVTDVVIATDEAFCVLIAKWALEGEEEAPQRKLTGSKVGQAKASPTSLPHPSLAAVNPMTGAETGEG